MSDFHGDLGYFGPERLDRFVEGTLVFYSVSWNNFQDPLATQFAPDGGGRAAGEE